MGPFALFRLQSHRLSAILKPSNNHIAVTGVGHLQTSQQATRVSVRVMKYVQRVGVRWHMELCGRGCAAVPQAD